jgi:uncharacterized phage-associated protein
MADSSARRVAEYLIAFSREVGDPLTNLKLQKLLYYAQGWFLALHDRPLFDERIEAWPHGPVVPPVYGSYKEWRWEPIKAEIDLNPDDYSGEVKGHLDEVMEVFGTYTAYQLERMTHREPPWLEARGSLPSDEPSNAVITPGSMARYFKELAAKQEIENKAS